MQRDSVITLDLHGKNVYQARVMLDAALRRAAGVYRIRVIHGHHRGTALRDMVRDAYAAHPKVLRIERICDSVTGLVLREP